MTEEEAREREALVNEYNRLVERRNRLAEEYNRLVVELQYSMEAAVDSINRASAAKEYVVPRLSVSQQGVAEVAETIKGVQNEIEQLSQKYFIMKNISTASKKMTQLNDEYQRKFGLYNTLRRVTLGYVVGVDKNIVSNERLRVTVEKNYLQNADYWISHCLMATMLWISDEKEAAERAVSKAMSIDAHKSSLFFLLINLQFGRTEAADKWFEYYMNDIDVKNVGDEIRILLQAYLYNICGNDPAFRQKISEEFNAMLEEVKAQNSSYDGAVRKRALEFISAYAHKTSEEFPDLVACADYRAMIDMLEKAEKNRVFAKYFTDLYETDSESPKDMTSRIQNVLYDLVNTYDEAELAILRDMDYNDMILQARGDVNAAQKMYSAKYQPKKPQSFGELLLKLAFPSNTEVVDIRVRKFAVTFLCQGIKDAFASYKSSYSKVAGDKHKVTIDSFTVTADENKPESAAAELRELYKQNRRRMIRKDKGVKTLTICTIAFWIAWICSTAFAGIWYSVNKEWSVIAIILFAVTFLAAVGFTVWLMFKRQKVGLEIAEKMEKALKKLGDIQKSIGEWREKYNTADNEINMLFEALDKFVQSEEA